MRLIIVIFTFFWSCWGVGYSFYNPTMTSISIAASGLIAFLTALVNYNQSIKKDISKQSQVVKGSSAGFQIGGNININGNEK